MTEDLSEAFLAAAQTEREALLARLTDLHERVAHFDTLAAEARAEVERTTRLVRDIEEMLGVSSQLAMYEMSEELRGERLREVAIQIIRECAGNGETIHYRVWYDALVEAGYRVVGKEPLAVFLTQVSRIDRVEKVGRRTGLYRLRLAA